jgi:hypothetical protein
MIDTNFGLRAHSMFLPVMTSRIMLSLKKIATERMRLWSLSTMGERGTINFAPLGIGVSQETSEGLPPPDGEDIELDSVLRLPQDRGSRELC